MLLNRTLALNSPDVITTKEDCVGAGVLLIMFNWKVESTTLLNDNMYRIWCLSRFLVLAYIKSITSGASTLLECCTSGPFYL